MAKKLSDEQCLANYTGMCELFHKALPDSERFLVVYGCGVDVGMMDYAIVRTHTYTYSSYVVGYDKSINEIVILPITPDLTSFGNPYYLKSDETIKAKRSWWSGEFRIQHKDLPKGYMNFTVPEHINEDPDEVCLCVKQNEQAKQFTAFFKEKFSK